jgi:hypothetical protein
MNEMRSHGIPPLCCQLWPQRYDIEDAIVMNKYSLDRGFGRCIVLKKFGVSLRKYPNRTNDRIVAPTPQPGECVWFVCLGESVMHSHFPTVVHISRSEGRCPSLPAARPRRYRQRRGLCPSR